MSLTGSNSGTLTWQVFTSKRPGLSRDLPPGKESLTWVANSATLIESTSTARQLYDAMLELYPDRVNPGSLWSGAKAAKNSTSPQH